MPEKSALRTPPVRFPVLSFASRSPCSTLARPERKLPACPKSRIACAGRRNEEQQMSSEPVLLLRRRSSCAANAPSIFNSIRFFNLQIPLFATPFVSHLYKTPGVWPSLASPLLFNCRPVGPLFSSTYELPFPQPLSFHNLLRCRGGYFYPPQPPKSESRGWLSIAIQVADLCDNRSPKMTCAQPSGDLRSCRLALCCGFGSAGGKL